MASVHIGTVHIDTVNPMGKEYLTSQGEELLNRKGKSFLYGARMISKRDFSLRGAV
jgi:hypothetical protein